EALVELAELIGEGPLEGDLAARHGPAAELVLEAEDPVGIARAVGKRFRHQEQAEAATARRRALRPRQQDREFGVGVRTEPLLAVEPPGVAVANSRQFGRADVGAAALLGHELRALQQRS